MRYDYVICYYSLLLLPLLLFVSLLSAPRREVGNSSAAVPKLPMISVSTSLSLYIYIHIEREREIDVLIMMIITHTQMYKY